MTRLISAIEKIPSKKTAIIIIVSTVCGVLAFAVIEPTIYAIAATGIAWLASVFTVWFIEDDQWIKRS